MKKLCTTALLFCVSVAASRLLAADIVGVSITVDSRNKMLPGDAAGAPGVRTTNWNNAAATASTTTPVSLGAGTLINQKGSVVPSLSVSITPNNNFLSRTTGSTNDTKMFPDVFDKQPGPTGNPAVIRVSGIPYSKYNVYFYHRTSENSGWFTNAQGGWVGLTNSLNTNFVMRYMKSQSNDVACTKISDVTTAGNGYLQAFTASIASQDSWANIDPGNFVEFTGLTNSDFTACIGTFGGSTGNKDVLGKCVTNGNATARLKFSGFQIEEVSQLQATNLTVTGASVKLYAGNPSSYPLTVTAQYTDGSSNVVTASATYSSADTNVFAIPSAVLQARHAGVANLVVSFQTLSVTQAVTVLAPTAVRPSVNPSTLQVATTGSDTAQAKLYADFSGATNVDVTTFNYVSFSNASPAIVTVTTSGLVTALAPGSFSLSATYEGVTGTTANAGTVSAFAPAGVRGISVNVTDSSHGMFFRDYSGVPGVRSPYWNNLPASGANINAGIANPVDSRGQILTNVGVRITGVAKTGVVTAAGYPSTNEGVMFASYYETGKDTPQSTLENNGTITVSNVPYASYDVYLYVNNDTNAVATNYPGHFIINGVEKRRKNSQSLPSMPNAAGSGYVEAVQPASVPDSMSDIPVGNYVKYTNLTDSNLTITYGAVTMDVSDTPVQTTFMRLAGFQIVSSVASLTATNIHLASPVPTLLPGDPNPFQLAVLADCTDGTQGALITSLAACTSSDPSVFTVSSSGMVSGVSGGTANLVVSYQGQTVTQAVTVLAPMAVRVVGKPAVEYSEFPLTNAQAHVWATFSVTNVIDVTAFNGVSFVDQGSPVGSVYGSGVIQPTGTKGTMAIGATYAGVTYVSTNAFMVKGTNDAATMTHRYTFRETTGSSTITDIVGGANGTVFPPVGTNQPITFDGERANFPGGSQTNAPYIALPSGLIGTMSDVTIELWAGLKAAPSNARWFSAGSSVKGFDPHSPVLGNAPTTLELGGTRGGSLLPFFNSSLPGKGTVEETGRYVLTNGAEYHLVAVYAPSLGVMKYYVNGVLQTNTAVSVGLDKLNDFDIWLGVSLANADAPLNGWISDLRIYEGAMNDAAVAASYAAGASAGLPDITRTVTNLYLAATVPSLLPGNPTPTPVTVLGDCTDGMLGYDVTALATYSSSAPSILTVTTNGLLAGVAPGTANLMVSYQGQSLTQAVTVLAPTSVRVTAVPMVEYLELGLTNAQAHVLATFGTTTLDISSFSGISFVDKGSPVGTVTTSGVIQPNQVKGSMSIGATYLGTSYVSTNVFAVRSTTDPVGLVHRYSFQDAPGSTTILDSVGGANGEVFPPLGTNLPITLDGERAIFHGGSYSNAPYITLPAGIIGSMGDVTFELWAGLNSAASNARWFGAGSTPKGNDPHVFGGNATTVLELGGTRGANGKPFFNALLPNQGGVLAEYGGYNLTNGTEYHFVGVYAPNLGVMKYYINGVLQTNLAVSVGLDKLNDLQVWLGVSLANADAPLDGWINELRIYEGAMSDAAVAASYTAGPGPGSVSIPSPALAVALSGHMLTLSWPAAATGYVLQTNSTLSGALPWGNLGIEPTPDGTNSVVTLPANESAKFYRLKK